MNWIMSKWPHIIIVSHICSPFYCFIVNLWLKLTIYCLWQRVWTTKQSARPAWSACPASWTACPQWSPVERLLWGTWPPSPRAALTLSLAHRRAREPDPCTTSCKENASSEEDMLPRATARRHRLFGLLQQNDGNQFVQSGRGLSRIRGPVSTIFNVVHEIVNM